MVPVLARNEGILSLGPFLPGQLQIESTFLLINPSPSSESKKHRGIKDVGSETIWGPLASETEIIYSVFNLDFTQPCEVGG